MPAKIDKEMLKKHHFWFLFIPVAFGLLLAWFGLFSEVDGTIEVQKTKNKKDAEAAKADAKPKKSLGEYDKQLSKLGEQRIKLWKEGWERQKDLFVWPSGYTDSQRNYLKNYTFGENIPEAFQVHESFAHADEKIYLNEYKQLVAKLEPMQFRDKDWKKVLARDQPDWGKQPDSEDMWLAMEDLWVQRELLLAIHKVNAEAAALNRMPSPDGKDDPKHRWFHNRNWELELWIDDQKGARVLKGKLKNVSGRLQLMGIGNVLQLEVDMKPDGKQFIFEVQGTPLEAGQEKPLEVKTLPSHTIRPDLNVKEIASVQQLFDSRTVPVKRIDYAELGKLCDRDKDLFPSMRLCSLSGTLAKAEGPAIQPAKPQVTTVDPSAPPPPPPPPDIPVYKDTSQDNLQRFRYIDVTEQLRRMPVGMVIVTDQSYMDDVLEALVNMKLPFQLTQVEWTRFHDSLEYGSRAPGEVPNGPSGFPAAGPSTSPTNSRDDQFSANLMQMSIYGIVSLYEQYPKKPPPKIEPKPADKK